MKSQARHCVELISRRVNALITKVSAAHRNVYIYKKKQL